MSTPSSPISQSVQPALRKPWPFSGKNALVWPLTKPVARNNSARISSVRNLVDAIVIVFGGRSGTAIARCLLLLGQQLDEDLRSAELRKNAFETRRL